MGILGASQKTTLEKFVSGAYKLDKLAGFLTEEQLDLSLAAGEWTIRQVVHHLAEDGEFWSMMIKRAIATPDVLIVPCEFPGNEPWANALAFSKRPIRAAVALLKSHRHVIAELGVFFSDKWDNCIAFSVPGNEETTTISIGQIISMLTDHMDEHLATIEAIRQKHGI